jgi:hypothetical protein
MTTTCVLCARVPSKASKAGSETPAAVFCVLCLSSFETSPEGRRRKHFITAKQDAPARTAVSDYVIRVRKERLVADEIAKTQAPPAEEKKAEPEPAKAHSNGVAKHVTETPAPPPAV